MSDAALAIFGIIFGWGLCAFVLRWNRPLILRHLDPAQWRRFPRYRALPLLNEGGRKQLEKFEAAFAEQRLTAVRWWFGAALFAAATFAILLILLEQARLRAHEAWEVEAFLSTPRLASFMLTAALGFGCRAHVREITAGLYAAFLIALVSTSKDESKKPDAPAATAPATPGAPATANGSPEAPPADAPAKVEGAADAKPGKVTGSFDAVLSKFPWFVEIGILASMVVAVVLLLNPQLLKNVTSFKAGGVEAHFATVNGTATVQGGQLANVDLSRMSTTKGWARFSYGAFEDISVEDRHVSNPQTDAAEIFFDRYLSIIFQYLSSLDQRHAPYELKTTLHGAILDLSTEIAAGETVIDQETIRKLDTIGQALCGQIIIDNISKALKDTSSTHAASERSYTLCEICDEKNKAKRSAKLAKIKFDQWDPYIIQAVGDLLFIISSRIEQEDFLVAATRTAKSDNTVCAETCETAGQLSLSYSVILAKVRSERPWPFQKMIDDLEKTLAGIDKILDRNRFQPSTSKLTDIRFRTNRLVDLTVGLELFYQRALQGQHLSAEQRQTWRDWLVEVKSFLDLYDAVATWPPPFDDDTLESWRRAKGRIESRTGTLQDAYVGAALGLVLIDPADDVSPHDCSLAHKFLDTLDRSAEDTAGSAGLNAFEKGTYLGFLEQVKAVVASRCASL